MSTLTFDPRRQRIALSVFQSAADLFRTIERLEAAGSDRASMKIIAATDSARQVASMGLTASPPEQLAAYRQVVSPESAMALEAALARGDIILVVPLRDMETEQLVSGLLLEASALSVQLHDLGT